MTFCDITTRAILERNVINAKKLTKNRVFHRTTNHASKIHKQQALQMPISDCQNFEFWNPIFLKLKILTIKKHRINVIEAGPGYAHAKFCGNLMIFDTQTV